MKLLRQIVKDYTTPLNEVRRGKWDKDDKFASWNVTGLVAAKGKIKLEVTNLWHFASPTKSYRDTLADSQMKLADPLTKGDQNKKKHAFWEKRYDIKITGQHFDASAKNEKGAVVPLVYNVLGNSLDTKINTNIEKEHKWPLLSQYRYGNVAYNKGNHKVWISGEKQDILDFFSSTEWLRSNDNNTKTNKETLAPLGIQKGDKKL